MVLPVVICPYLPYCLGMATTRVNGAAIRVIRERSDMSVKDLVDALAADGVKIHRDYLYNIELGRKQPSEKVTGAIARALRCPRIALLADPTEPVAASV